MGKNSRGNVKSLPKHTMTIKIGIDGNEANTKKRVGIGQYAFHTITSLYALRKKEKNTSYRYVSFEIYLKDKPLSDLPTSAPWWKYKVFGPSKMWTQFALPFHLTLFRSSNIFFSPSHYAPRFLREPSVISIMDLSFFHFPELFNKKDLYQLENWTSYSVKNASKIFTISQFSKEEIIKYYQVNPDSIVVTYPGFDDNLYKKREVLKKEKEAVKKKFCVGENFILFVGTIQPRKNIVKLLDAFERIINSGQFDNFQLLLVGKKGWMYEGILTHKKYLMEEKKVIFTDFAEDEDLSLLYNLASCFILPSLYEGFGIPVIESLACGCPAVLSNVSSLPEIAGDAACFIDPTDSTSIEEGIKKVLTDALYRKNLIQKGFEQIKKFSWDLGGEQTFKTLIEVATQPK